MGNAKTDAEASVLRWQEDDVDEGDALHTHFTELVKRGDLRGWMDVADEGRRIWGRMFERIDAESPIHNVLYAVAAAGYEAAMQQVAARLGASPRAVECACEPDGPPDIDRFLRECREAT